MAKVINPYTGKPIKLGSPAFNQIVSDVVKLNIQQVAKKSKRSAKKVPKQVAKKTSKRSTKRSPAKKTSKRSPAKKTSKRSPAKRSPAINFAYTGVRTAGWAAQSPRRGRERSAMSKKCGSSCFLLPREKKFPICPKNSCKKSCKGLLSAKIRAKQYKYNKVASKAEALMRKHKC